MYFLCIGTMPDFFPQVSKRAAALEPARRKCLFIYFYFMDREFGLIHVKLQTWFPMQIQIYVNGHDWLERKLTANGISFTKHDNVFLRIEDWKRAQKLSDRFTGLNWPWILERYARYVNPLLKDLLRGYQHYWVTSQSEYSTDIAFKSSSDLRELFPRLLSHSTLCFGAKDVMGFLGRKLTGHFLGEIISDMKDGGGHRRIPGARIKHRVKENWLKMYDKDGSVLRVEMVINNPEEFKVRKKVSRKNKRVLEWVSMRKGVAYLFRYREVSQQANYDIWRRWRLSRILRLQSGNWTILRQERRHYPAAAYGHSIRFRETTYNCSRQ